MILICPRCSKSCRSLFDGICRRCAGKSYGTQEWRNLSRAVRERDGQRCLEEFKLPDTGRVIPTGGCGKIYPMRALQAAHIVPREDGGVDGPENVVTLCRVCHARQTAREDGAMGNRRRLGFMNGQLTAQERAARTRGRPRVFDGLLTAGDLEGIEE